MSSETTVLKLAEAACLQMSLFDPISANHDKWIKAASMVAAVAVRAAELESQVADLLASLVAADAFISHQTRLWEEAPACFDLVRATIARAKGSKGLTP